MEILLKDKIREYHKAKIESINPNKFLEFEIETFEKLFSVTPPQNARKVDLGNLILDVVSLTKIQKYYRQAVGGRTSFNLVLSPKQKLRIGTQRDEMKHLFDSLMYSKYLDFLKSEKQGEELNNKSSESSDYYNTEELKEIKVKIDEVLLNLDKLGHGQEIIHDEIESLKSSSKKNSKKDFKDLVLGKLVDLGLNQALDSETAKSIFQKLFGDDFPKLLK
ncbi:MAG: hypothetical protein KF763_18490 [Cyclobacteriaceae bacterium]|nr:hypothetical protein [Cyclobacteriaceae bacterium]